MGRACVREFFNVGHDTIFEIINAADYLNIQHLIDEACRSIANRIKGKTPEEIRKTFNIEKEFNDMYTHSK